MVTGDENEVAVLDRVALTYPGPPAVTALHPADLTIARGDYVSVVGPSGSGKSTFLNILGLLDRPTSGRYLLDGIDTATLDEGRRSALRGRRIGFVFQAYHLVPQRTALENVMLGLLYRGIKVAERRSRASGALERVGLAHRAQAVPTQLSGGERQRVAIARALVGEPSLLLCDEPTGNLDSASARTILDLIAELWRGGATILAVTHDESVAERANRRLEIVDGRLTVS